MDNAECSHSAIPFYLEWFEVELGSCAEVRPLRTAQKRYYAVEIGKIDKDTKRAKDGVDLDK